MWKLFHIGLVKVITKSIISWYGRNNSNISNFETITWIHIKVIIYRNMKKGDKYSDEGHKEVKKNLKR